MDTLNKSLELLKDYLSQTTRSERSKVWSEVKDLDIAGPSVQEYLESVQKVGSDFNNSFSIGSFCDDIVHSIKFNELLNKVQMQEYLFIESSITIPSSTSCQEDSAGECAYALAA